MHNEKVAFYRTLKGVDKTEVNYKYYIPNVTTVKIKLKKPPKIIEYWFNPILKYLCLYINLNSHWIVKKNKNNQPCHMIDHGGFVSSNIVCTSLVRLIGLLNVRLGVHIDSSTIVWDS